MSGFFRLDRAPLARPVSAKIFEGRVARVHVPGDALIYSTGPEHRDVEEVQNIVNQLPGLKIYLGHPSIPADKSGQKPVGHVETGRLDDDSAVARMVIEDQDALKAIDDGTHELSLGYHASLVEGRYQKDIKLDHLALVARARCGASCALRADEQGEYTVKLEVTEELKQMLDGFVSDVKDAMKMCPTCEKPMKECEGHEDKAPKGDCTCKSHAMPHNNGESMADTTNTDLSAEVAALQAKLDEANKKLTELEVGITNATKDAEAATVKLAAAETALETAKSDAAVALAKAKSDAEEALAAEISKKVDARVKLLSEAGKVVKDDLTALDERAIKCAVIKHVDGDEVPAEKSMDYVTGVYEGALKRADGAAASREAVRTVINETRKDNAPALTGKAAEKAAYERMKSDSASAWTKTN